LDITRREAVRRLSLLLGGTASASTITALLSGCRARPTPVDWAPSALSSAQLDVLGAVVDHIIPRTDTPGARDVGVPAFIDLLLDRWAEADERDRFLEGLDGLDAAMREAHATDFLAGSVEQQVALLTGLDDAGVRARDANEDPLPWFATLKEWTLTGYYTSEAGATQELQWLATPGRFDGDAALAEVGRAWA
jgi:gluconate 2-dehydrogenase gamma chain